jgi:hypothetical protein
MRTTIDLPDELLRQVKARAALDGLKLKDLITRYVEQGLRQGAQSPPRCPNTGAASSPSRGQRLGGRCPRSPTRKSTAFWRRKSPPVASLIDLPDINVWLAFSVADHPHHQRARRY